MRNEEEIRKAYKLLSEALVIAEQSGCEDGDDDTRAGVVGLRVGAKAMAWILKTDSLSPWFEELLASAGLVVPAAAEDRRRTENGL